MTDSRVSEAWRAHLSDLGSEPLRAQLLQELDRAGDAVAAARVREASGDPLEAIAGLRGLGAAGLHKGAVAMLRRCMVNVALHASRDGGWALDWITGRTWRLRRRLAEAPEGTPRPHLGWIPSSREDCSGSARAYGEGVSYDRCRSKEHCRNLAVAALRGDDVPPDVQRAVASSVIQYWVTLMAERPDFPLVCEPFLSMKSQPEGDTGSRAWAAFDAGDRLP